MATKYGAFTPPPPIENLLYRDLRQWRGELFGQLKGHNQDLSRSKIDEIIQKFFNRLIFIRTCEDRGIENKQVLEAVHQWERAGHKGELLDTVKSIFQQYEGWYDSDLFSKHLVDTGKVFVEGPTVEHILRGMAKYPFDLIDADVLGAVYEQYLGFVAVENKESPGSQLSLGITDDTTYKVVDKKRYRKEQGIYYTPKFITDYIVKETVGRFLKERNYNEVRNIKILDPACGSGSFLIRAYDELLKYHASQKCKPVADLDQWERLPVLTGNIFGVDLDMQAVEIARLNLLLRCLAKRGILEPLANNIKQGNSLISGDEEELSGYFGVDWKQKKPFNWEEAFPDKVDVVVGNPPYGADSDEHDRDYVEEYYPHSKNNKNSAMVFIEKGLSLTKEGGFFSFIIPKSLAYSQKWASGRELVLDKLGNVSDASKAFKGVLLEQMVIIISKKFEHRPFYESISLGEDGETKPISISKKASETTDTILLGITDSKEPHSKLWGIMGKGAPPQGTDEAAFLPPASWGVSSGDFYELQIFNKMTSSNLFMRDISKTARGLPFQRYLIKDTKGIPIYRGAHIARYALYKTVETVPEDVLATASQKVAFLRQPKILSQQIIAHVLNPTDHIILMSTYDKDKVLTLDTVQNTILIDRRFTYSFITALLNSTLWSWYAYRFIYSKAIRTMHFDEYYIRKFPLPLINFSNSTKKIHEDIATAADSLLELNKRLLQVRDIYSNERDELLKESEHTDREIDDLVYDLYGLTEEERKIVEEAVKKE